MTASKTNLPSFVARQEGDGCIVYLPDSATYLYADAAAYGVLIELKERDPAEVTAMVAASLNMPADEADSLARGVVDVLAGRRVGVGEGNGRQGLLCPLSRVVGPEAERCETFGMPL